jgi:protein-disulfide isomerase
MEATVVNNGRRNFLIGAGALVLAAVAGGGYYYWTQGPIALDPGSGSGTPTTSGGSAELMAPGPLEEMVMGNPNAPVTIIEYASMSCPHCAHFHETVYPDLKSRLVETGKVRFIFREFPLDALALVGSMMARCAGKDKYFAMVEMLFQQQRQWANQRWRESLQALTKQAGMTQEEFDACLKDEQVKKGIEQISQRAAEKFGVNSTPTFFINGKKFSGGMEIQDIEREVAPYLKS